MSEKFEIKFKKKPKDLTLEELDQINENLKKIIETGEKILSPAKKLKD